MKKTLARVLSLMLVLVMAFSMLVSCKKDDEAGTIKIGFSGPLSGGAAMYGIAVQNSAQMAIEEINAMEDNGLDGIKFELIYRDDQHDATKIEQNFTQLLADGMQISLGTVTTGPGLAYKTLAKDENVFFLTPSASGDKIPEFANGYQMCFADSNQGGASAEIFNRDYQGKKIGVFYKSDDDYSKGIYSQFKANLDDSFELVEATFTESTATDFSTQINALKACDVIFMPIYYTPASLFMQQGVGIIKDDATYYGCDGFDGIDAIKGFDIQTIPQEVIMLSHFDSTAKEGPAADYIAKYKEKFGEDAPLNQFGAAAYDCVYAIYEALKVAKANGKNVTADLSPADYNTMLQEVFNGDFTFRGITGETTATEKSYISWESTGYVNKVAVPFQVKAAN